MAAIEELVGARARDDQGRYISATPAEPIEAAAPTEPVQPVATPPEPSPVETQPVVPVVATPAAPIQPVESPQELAYKKAMHSEREKRQAAEARHQAAEAKLREFQTPKPQIDPWTDLPGALKSQEQAFEERLFLERCNTTEELARTRHTDFDDVRSVFVEAAEANPQLWAQVRQERNPAEYVYREGIRIRELKDVGGDFTAYRSKLEKDVETRVRAEFEAKYKQTPAVPASLNSEGSPPVAETPYQGPKPLNQILRNASRS